MTEPSLGVLLKKLRRAAGLTQEELAQRAAISARTVSDVERGLRGVVHGSTAARLAAALDLDEQDRARFDALTRRPRAVGDPTGGLPVPPTRLWGRARELASIDTFLKDPAVRLLTLTGPGGIGKTRLALEAATRTRTHFPGGVYFVSLGELRDATLVAPELAKAVGVVETGAALTDLLATRFAESPALVVMDTFEHLMPAGPLVYSLLLSCPQTTFLVTSRSALRLRGEYELPVPPLDVPSPGRPAGPDDVPVARPRPCSGSAPRRCVRAWSSTTRLPRSLVTSAASWTAYRWRSS